jgi:hypothetical protein
MTFTNIDCVGVRVVPSKWEETYIPVCIGVSWQVDDQISPIQNTVKQELNK